MADPAAPEEHVAEALQDLSTQARSLVRSEIKAAQHEILEKIKPNVPAGALAVGGILCGVFASAAFYRLTLRTLERRLPPGVAAFGAAVGFGVAGIGMGRVGIQRLREAPVPLPTETVKENLRAGTGGGVPS